MLPEELDHQSATAQPINSKTTKENVKNALTNAKLAKVAQNAVPIVLNIPTDSTHQIVTALLDSSNNPEKPNANLAARNASLAQHMAPVLTVNLQESVHQNVHAQLTNLKTLMVNVKIVLINAFHAQDPLTIVTLANALTVE